jgi:hypothetical protein
MDALPPDIAHESRPLPDRRSTNATRAEAPKPTLVTVRVGVGVGLGTSGVAAHELAQAELFPWPFLGIGVEGERAGSTGLGLLDPVDSDELSAVRGRLALRFHHKNSSFVAAIAIGRAEVTTTHESNSPASSCSSLLCWDYETHRHRDVTASAVLELGGRFNVRVVEFGGQLRIDVSPPAVIVSAGPTLGLAF